MKRHPAFQDLSRDHFTALLACLNVRRATEGHPSAPTPEAAIAQFGQLWRNELTHHFDEEDANIQPVLAAKKAHTQLATLRLDHKEIRAAMEALHAKDPAPTWAVAAERLRAHIRWEEDVLFPWMQDHLTDEELERMLAASIAFRTKVRGPDSVKPPRP